MSFDPQLLEDRDRCDRLLRELEQRRPARSDIIQLPLKLPLAVLRSRRDTVLHGVQDDLLQVVIDEGCWSFPLFEVLKTADFWLPIFALLLEGMKRVDSKFLQPCCKPNHRWIWFVVLAFSPKKNPPREALNERKDGGLPRVTRYDFLRMDLVPSNVEGTEATWEFSVIFFWMHMGPSEKISDTCSCRNGWKPYLQKQKQKVAIPRIWIHDGKKNTTFCSCFLRGGQPFADEDTNRGLHAGALLPFSYKRGEGAFQVKSVKHNSCLSLS